MVATGLLVVTHLGAVRWGRFALAFALIDLVGYLPGAWAFRRARGGRIAPVFHHLYNVTHSFVSAGLVLSLWAALGGFEWAMLAMPLHLTGDRGLFGNGPKPADRAFEHPVREAA
jgi:hypothetical protein